MGKRHMREGQHLDRRFQLVRLRHERDVPRHGGHEGLRLRQRRHVEPRQVQNR